MARTLKQTPKAAYERAKYRERKKQEEAEKISSGLVSESVKDPSELSDNSNCKTSSTNRINSGRLSDKRATDAEKKLEQANAEIETLKNKVGEDARAFASISERLGKVTTTLDKQKAECLELADVIAKKDERIARRDEELADAKRIIAANEIVIESGKKEEDRLREELRYSEEQRTKKVELAADAIADRDLYLIRWQNARTACVILFAILMIVTLSSLAAIAFLIF